MGFFVEEYFGLPGGELQDSIVALTAGSGGITASNGRGNLLTYAIADAAIIVPDEGLTPSEFASTPFRMSIKYKISSMGTSDSIFLFGVSLKESTPEIDAVGAVVISAFIFSSAAGTVFYEYWQVACSDGQAYRYNGAGGVWGDSSGANYVRSVNLNTEYTLTIEYDPGTRSVVLSNGVQTSPPSNRLSEVSNNWWWFSGIYPTTDHYGVLSIDYLTVERTGIASDFKVRNELMTEQWYSSHYSGAHFIGMNSLLTEIYNALVVPNNIQDYVLVGDDLAVLNRIGKMPSIMNTSRFKVTYKGCDISNAVESYGISFKEAYTKSFSLEVRKEAIKPWILKKGDTNFLTPEIEIFVDQAGTGDFITRGRFFIERVSYTHNNDNYLLRISGSSYTSILDRPRSPIQSWNLQNTTKRAVIKNFLEEYGIDFTWELPDGPLNNYVITEKTKLQVIQQMVSAIGGRVSTDGEDRLLFYANNYFPEKKSPVYDAVIESSHTHSLTVEEEIPRAQNKIVVSGRANDQGLFSEWATVVLYSVDSHGYEKLELTADGSDSVTLLAYCYDIDGQLVDVKFHENESASPTDAHTIPVSNWIDTAGVIGVWKDDNGSPGDLIEGPYTFEGNQITTVGEMLDGPHLVTYWGGETVSFSIDGPGEVTDSTAIIRNGFGQTTLMGTQGTGGFIIVTARYAGQLSAPVVISLGDPRVGSISASANPTNLKVREPSQITAVVLKPDGSPVEDGYVVDFEIVGGSGKLSDESAETTTITIENEDSISIDRDSVSVDQPITNLVHIYRVLNNDEVPLFGSTLEDQNIDIDMDYAEGAEVNGSMITLMFPLPEHQTRVVVTYDTGGAASIYYTAPDSVGQNGETVTINVKAGGINRLLTLEVGRATGAGSGGLTPGIHSSGGNKAWNELTFSGQVQLDPGDSKYYKDGKEVLIPDDKSLSIGEYGGLVEGGSLVKIEKLTLTGKAYLIATFLVNRHTEIQDHKTVTGDISGSRVVFEKGTENPVVGATVKIYWSGDSSEFTAVDEELTTDSNGVFEFKKGKPGTWAVEATHPNYEDYSGTIEIGGDIDDYAKTTSIFELLQYDITVQYRFV